MESGRSPRRDCRTGQSLPLNRNRSRGEQELPAEQKEKRNSVRQETADRFRNIKNRIAARGSRAGSGTRLPRDCRGIACVPVWRLHAYPRTGLRRSRGRGRRADRQPASGNFPKSGVIHARERSNARSRCPSVIDFSYDSRLPTVRETAFLLRKSLETCSLLTC